MADSDPAYKAGEKRPADLNTGEKRPPKIRRFDVTTRVPKPQVAESDVKGVVGDTREDKSGTVRRDRTSLVTMVVAKKEGSGIVCDTGLPADKKSPHVSQRLEPVASGSQELKPEVSENDKVSETMSVNKMFQTSLELQQAESGESHKEDKNISQHRNIVDQLFQDFVTTKMREVDDGAKSLSDEGSTRSSVGPENEKTQVSLSIEEINRLLDAEITSIKSRSVVADLTPEDIVMNTKDQRQIDSGSNFAHSSQDTSAAPTESGEMLESFPGPSQPSVQSSSVAEVFSDFTGPIVNPSAEPEDDSTEMMAGEVKGLLASKTKETKKLGLSIGQETLARIMGNWKNGHILEEGEVASSTDSDAEKAFRVELGAEEESNDSDEVSGTGSLSDSDKGKIEGKDGKVKKKKKHKHKHKKKKKHKTQSKEKEREESDKHSIDGRSSKDRKDKDDVAKKEVKESKSKDKKKSSRHKSKSPRPFDQWDARCYRTDSTRPRSRSPLSSRSRHQDRSKDRSRDHSRERTRGHSRDRSPERSRDRKRERSKERHKRSRDRSKERSKKRSNSKEKEKDKHAADSSGDKDLRLKIDKTKLRKIAIARALANMERGQGPAVDLTSVKSGGKSVAELTEFCKRISQKENGEEDNLSSDNEISEEERTSEGEDGPLHHPFIMRDPSSMPNIVMNIRNAKQLPILTPQEKQTQAATLRTQFPVSSGTQHRNKESDWVPVTTTTATTATLTKSTAASTAVAAKTTTSTFAVPMVPAAAPVSAGIAGVGNGGGASMVVPTVTTPALPAEQSVFPPAQMNIDIGSIVSQRIHAMRRLEQNPFDVQALTSVHRINEQTNAWAQSKHLPGQFTGTTDVRILTQEELAGPDKRNQAWVKKDQFRKAPPVQGGIGMFLLQKMGWKPGDGLGKDNEGNKEPLMLDVKMDRKGLSTTQDARPPQMLGRCIPPPAGGFSGVGGAGVGVAVVPRAKDLSGKHPVSALTELCTKRRWGAPAFDLISENGPAHKKTFLFKVRVNGVEYVPSAACGNKKLAKAQAAAVCLQEMGLIPRDFVVQV